MKANTAEKAIQGAFDLLKAIEELKTLIPQVRDKLEEMEERVTKLENENRKNNI